MDNLIAEIEKINNSANAFAWGPIMLALLVGTGIFLSIRTGLIQVGHFGFMLKGTVGSLFKKSDKNHSSNLSPFQAATTALSGNVGTGNIAGVTGAIFAEDPGAVFRMWVSAFFGMCIKYTKIALAVKYREVDANSQHHGGSMYYVTNGLDKNWKWLVFLFALLGGIASFGIL